MTKIAVAIFHGIGCKGPTFGGAFVRKLTDRLQAAARRRGGPAATFVFKPIHWGHIAQCRQDELCEKLTLEPPGAWPLSRRLVIDWLGDAIAYEPTSASREVYDAVHRCVAQNLAELADDAGESAPLCVVAHSFGSIVARDHFRELQRERSVTTARSSSIHADATPKAGVNQPLVNGHTLSTFVTLGSPLGLWSIRQHDTGEPLKLPAPELQRQRPGIEGIWLNILSHSDVLAFPLKELGVASGDCVIDLAVRLRGILTGWNLLSHFQYWQDDAVVDSIAVALNSLAADCAAKRESTGVVD